MPNRSTTTTTPPPPTTTTTTTATPPPRLIIPIKLRRILEQSPRWMIVGAIVTPTVALLQGIALLQNYRKHHTEMPYPNSPSQGLVVAVDERHVTYHHHGNHNNTTITNNNNNNNNNNKNNNNDEPKSKHSSIAQFLRLQRSSPPLRLLVIGDSLAAGVGVVHRATPVLPESIARTLSQKMGGRPVYWTCIGKPGAVLQEVIQNIEMHDQMLMVKRPTREPMPLWQEAVDQQADTLRKRTQRIQEWWHNRNSNNNQHRETTTTSSKNPKDTTKNTIVNWWNGIQQDIRSFRKAWSREPKYNPNDDENYADTEEDDEEDEGNLALTDPFKLWQTWKRRLQRRESLRGDPSVVGQYDIAVVITGGNDIKQAWLPFMFVDNDDNNSDHGKSVPEKFHSLVKALQSRMKLALDRTAKEGGGDKTKQQDPDDSAEQFQNPLDDTSLIRTNTQRRPPIIIFPALPITLVPQFHSPPMSWFIFYVFSKLENYKRAMARKFPGQVLFVEPPPAELVAQIQASKGKIYEDRRAEEVLLKLTNVTQRVQENFERKWEEYREKVTRMMVMDRESQSTHHHHHNNNTQHDDDDNDDDDTHHHHPDESYHEYKDTNQPPKSRSLILSLDQLHPNDEGYDIWGRHIAAEILKHWNANEPNQANNATHNTLK